MFDDTEIVKYKFHQYKNPISIDNIGVNKIVLSNKICLVKKGYKYFNGCKDAKKYTFTHIPSKKECTQKTKCKSFMIKDEKLLEKYNEIWKEKSATLSKRNLTANLYAMKNI